MQPRTIVAVFVLTTCAASHAAEVAVPDSCNNGVCLTDVRWKKGVLEHTIVGSIRPERGAIESAVISFSYSDERRNGSGRLRVVAINKPYPFYFKVNSAYVKWDQSKVGLTVSAILGIEPMHHDGGLSCEFASLGSRLSATIKNGSDADVVLDYQLLTLTAGGRNLKLNGSHGKYADQATPNPATLIASKTEQREALIAVGSATFAGGDWVEDWRMHEALVAENPTLTLSIGKPGAGQLEKIPLEVKAARLEVSGGPPKK